MNQLHIAPIFRSLLFPATIIGMPKNLFFGLSFITLAIVSVLQQWWFIAIFVLLIVFFNFMTKNDPFFFDIYTDVIKLPEVMD
jgi:type IV secretory pathway VirB3-like protein